MAPTLTHHCGGGDISQHIQDAKKQTCDGKRYLGPLRVPLRVPSHKTQSYYLIHLAGPLNHQLSISGMEGMAHGQYLP